MLSHQDSWKRLTGLPDALQKMASVCPIYGNFLAKKFKNGNNNDDLLQTHRPYRRHSKQRMSTEKWLAITCYRIGNIIFLAI